MKTLFWAIFTCTFIRGNAKSCAFTACASSVECTHTELVIAVEFFPDDDSTASQCFRTWKVSSIPLWLSVVDSIYQGRAWLTKCFAFPVRAVLRIEQFNALHWYQERINVELNKEAALSFRAHQTGSCKSYFGRGRLWIHFNKICFVYLRVMVTWGFLIQLTCDCYICIVFAVNNLTIVKNVFTAVSTVVQTSRDIVKGSGSFAVRQLCVQGGEVERQQVVVPIYLAVALLRIAINLTWRARHEISYSSDRDTSGCFLKIKRK